MKIHWLAVFFILLFGLFGSAETHGARMPSNAQPSKEAEITVHDDEYEDLYFAILAVTDGPNASEAFFTLPESAQHLHFVALFDMEIQNGGLCQFFANCGSSYASHISQSLRIVGLPEIADLYDDFIARNGIDPSDLSSFSFETIDDYIALTTLYPYDEFDEVYMALWQELDFNQVVMDYAHDHPEAFE